MSDAAAGTARPTSRLANDAWEALLVAHATMLKRLAVTGAWTEVSMREYDVLYTLSKTAEPIQAKELERHILLSQPALSRLLDRLVGRGLVVRTPDPADGRSSRLGLTEDGRKVQRRVGRRHAADVTELVSANLSADEQAALAALCRRLATGAPAGRGYGGYSSG